MNETAFDHGTASVALGRALFKSESGRKLAAAGPVERTPAFRKKARSAWLLPPRLVAARRTKVSFNP